MNKLEMAHDYFMKHGRNNSWMESDVVDAWKYADAMQKEWDEREQQKQDKLKQDQQNHHDELVSIGLDEWQPDWSQAPEWAEWWAVDGFGDKKAHWYRDKPYLDDDSEIESEWNAELYSNKDAFVWSPSFGYQGDWKDSLRKRP